MVDCIHYIMLHEKEMNKIFNLTFNRLYVSTQTNSKGNSNKEYKIQKNFSLLFLTFLLIHFTACPLITIPNK